MRAIKQQVFNLTIATALATIHLAPTASAQNFESRAVVQVFDTTGDWAKSEIEMLTSDQTLIPAVEKLKLAEKWNLQAVPAAKRIRQMLSAEPVDDTTLITIRIRADDAKLAQTVCEAVVNSYRERRKSQVNTRAQRALEALDAELAQQQRLTKEKRKQLATVIDKHGEDPDNEAFAKAREDYLAEEAVFQNMKEIHAEQARSLQIPRLPVTVHEAPTLPTKPVKE